MVSNGKQARWPGHSTYKSSARGLLDLSMDEPEHDPSRMAHYASRISSACFVGDTSQAYELTQEQTQRTTSLACGSPFTVIVLVTIDSSMTIIGNGH